MHTTLLFSLLCACTLNELRMQCKTPGCTTNRCCSTTGSSVQNEHPGDSIPISMQCVLGSKLRKAMRKIHPRADRPWMGNNTLQSSFSSIALTGKKPVTPSLRSQPPPCSTCMHCFNTHFMDVGWYQLALLTCSSGNGWPWTSVDGATGEMMGCNGPEGWRRTFLNDMQSHSSTFWADDGALFMCATRSSTVFFCLS